MMPNVIGTVSKENIWHFTCAYCSGTWSVAVMDEWQPGELYCTHCGKPTRTGIRYLEEGSRTRVCKKCQQDIE